MFCFPQPMCWVVVSVCRLLEWLLAWGHSPPRKQYCEPGPNKTYIDIEKDIFERHFSRHLSRKVIVNPVNIFPEVRVRRDHKPGRVRLLIEPSECSDYNIFKETQTQTWAAPSPRQTSGPGRSGWRSRGARPPGSRTRRKTSQENW